MSTGMSTLASVAQSLASGALTSVALTEQMIARAQDSTGEGARVYTRLFLKQARAQALVSDQLRQAGLTRSPLEGIVLGVKDLFDVRGYTTRSGSVVLRDNPPANVDARIVERLSKAGAVILGSTNMTEFAYSGLGLNPHYGTPRNPWDRQTGRIPGGSSSGCAVAVTDVMAHATIGTDTGGSVRIPAALCGVTAFKPTARRIDATGMLPLSTTLDSIGPLAPSLRCCEILDKVMAGESDLSPVAPRPLSTLTLGVPKQLVLQSMDAQVGRDFERACKLLSAAGVRIVDVDLPQLDELPHINRAGGLSAAESWHWHQHWLQKNGQAYDPRVAVRIRAGANQSASDYIGLLEERAHWIARVTQAICHVDAMLMPTVPIVAPEISILEQDEERYFHANMLMLRNPSIINFLDGCSLSLPCHEPGQAPVGLMLSAAGGRDQHLMAVGLACESVLEAARR